MICKIAGDEHAATLASSVAASWKQLLFLEHPATAATVTLRSPITGPSIITEFRVTKVVGDSLQPRYTRSRAIPVSVFCGI